MACGPNPTDDAFLDGLSTQGLWRLFLFPEMLSQEAQGGLNRALELAMTCASNSPASAFFVLRLQARANIPSLLK